MALGIACLSSFLTLLLLVKPIQVTSDKQSQYFTLMKSFLSGKALSNWHAKGEDSYCNYTGITCNFQGQVTKIHIAGWSLKGSFPPDVCTYLPELRALDISNNFLQGRFPAGFTNCSLLEELHMSYLYMRGKLPNFSLMKSLRVLELDTNLFTGDFPMSITNLTNLEVVNFNEIGMLNYWNLPEDITRLTRLKTLILSTTSLQGHILSSIGNMTSLVDLELSGNSLKGQIPPELGKLKNLKFLMLYFNIDQW